ncbi:MAG TPA: hypothetical protein VGR62_23710 [Candidatus Binatia bacterium]|jgi:alkylhydroperoxidase family enzyme|nr:hypothetical protein [Candidatus Binatia bacterium]
MTSARTDGWSSADWGVCLVPAGAVPPALAADIRQRVGSTPAWLGHMAAVPWVARATSILSMRPAAFAPLPLCDLVALAVSQDNSCRYCYGVQRAYMTMLGYPDDYAARLERDTYAGSLTPLERAALDLARRLSRGQPRPGRADLDVLAATGLSPEAAVEVVATIAAITFANRLSTLLALPPDPLESMVDRPLFRLVRPLVAWKMRPRPLPPAVPLPAESGPWARVMTTLGRSPVAGELRRVVDDAFASPVLPRRTKALMTAVIGRALGCAYSEAEARRLAADDGIGTADADEILTNLGSSRLEARDARLLAFARETVRYQTPVIQRRVREVTAGFTPDQILETVGVVSLANLLARMTIVLDAC